MVRNKQSNPQRREPGYVSTHSDTGRMHKPSQQVRWRAPNMQGLYDTTGPFWSSIPGGRWSAAGAAVNRAWRQANPRPANRVPSLQELARRNIPGLAMFAMARDGTIRPHFLNPQHTRPRYPKGTFSH